MHIKNISWSLQQALQGWGNVDFSRSHGYELLAALFGFSTYSAFSVAVVPVRARSLTGCLPTDKAAAARRARDLGLDATVAGHAADKLVQLLEEAELRVMRIDDLVVRLGDPYGIDRDDDDEDGPWEGFVADEDGWICEDTLEGLTAAAKRNIAAAHYALALIHAPTDAEDGNGIGSEYWYEQAKQGEVLSGVQKEWAEAWAAHLASVAAHARHLQQAAELGNAEALLDMADQFADPAFFERGIKNVAADPRTVADIAERLHRFDAARAWLSRAAEGGDTCAMRDLIETYDHGDPLLCRMWWHLALLHGEDLTQDRYIAINPDGSIYDWDVGGPAEVGGEGGIKLPSVDATQDAIAAERAKTIWKRMRSGS